MSLTCLCKLAQPPALAFLIICGSVVLLAQPAEDRPAAEVPEERAETLRLVGSSEAKERNLAVKRLCGLSMDFELLWKLMNDPDASVRLHAIDGFTSFSCTEAVNLSLELARKMEPLLEKEVRQERIDAAFKRGQIQDEAASFVVCSMLGLYSLYALYPELKNTRDDGARWEEVTLHPLMVKLAAARRETSDFVDFHYLKMLQPIGDAGLLMIELKKLAETLDDEELPSSRLLSTVETLWRDHPLLGESGALNLMLLAELSPRLESLKLRILSPMKEGPEKEHAASLLEHIEQFIPIAREKFTLQPAKAAEK